MTMRIRNAPPQASRAIQLALAIGLKISALALLLLLLLKALFDVDDHFDSWWYHLPWAARLAGIVSPDAYLFEPVALVRFEGFPFLPELLQGLLWRLTTRVESANLVSYGSLIAFVWFLRHFFRVPWWLTVPALLAIPLVQGQVTSTYVDLIANLSMAALVLTVYLLYVRPKAPDHPLLMALSLSAFIAANSKLQLLPLVALALLLSAPPLMKWFLLDKNQHLSSQRKMVICCIALAIAAAVFAVPLKNLVRHGNPVYPIQVTVLGHALNGVESSPPESLGGGALEQAPRLQKWFYSVFEVGMGPILDVRRWTLDSSAPPGSPLGIQGGLFGVYVAWNLAIFVWLVSKAARRERRVATSLVILAAVTAAVMPASHLLRYYMFWFISLIGLNLHLLSIYGSEVRRLLAGGVSLLFVLVVVDATDQNFVRPRFHSVADLLSERLDQRILLELTKSPSACLALDKANEPFLYASIWHPGTRFSITAGPFFPLDAKEIEQTCGARRVITTSR